MTFSRTRQRILLALAEHGPMKQRDIARAVGIGIAPAHRHLMRLREAGLAEPCAPSPLCAGYRLRPGVVVGECGFVGRVVPLETAGRRTR